MFHPLKSSFQEFFVYLQKTGILKNLGEGGTYALSHPASYIDDHIAGKLLSISLVQYKASDLMCYISVIRFCFPLCCSNIHINEIVVIFVVNGCQMLIESQ